MYEPPMKEVKPSSMMHEPPMSEPVKEVKPTSAMYEPPMKEEKPTSMMHEPSPTTMSEPMKEVKPTQVVKPPQYGSGSTPPPQNAYNDCVSKCMATYGAPPTKWTPPPSPPTEAGKPSSGEFITVLVAPVDGVLRYLPPMVEVPVGKTVKFVWNGTKPHTVSKGSALDLCNKTADAFFTSGNKTGPAEFTQTVNNTDPIYFYCAVSPHCSKGMFGIVNMPKAAGTNHSVEAYMPLMTAQSPDLAAAWTATQAKVQGTPAEKWGNDYDISAIPAEHREGTLATIMYYRQFLADNKGVQELNAGATLPAGVTEFNFPQDISNLLSNSASNPAGGPGAAAGGAPTDSTPTGAAPNPNALANNSNAAGTLKSSGFMVAVVAILATLVAL